MTSNSLRVALQLIYGDMQKIQNICVSNDPQILDYSVEYYRLLEKTYNELMIEFKKQSKIEEKKTK
ncbi:hypothetical protein [Campylobacter fetus]|uniref:hypothetical protein n=1 Tax=Campylobacter fetus TaxID=196 RepID=UPI00138E3015|nr:hypothetical protein [Campylobacter fetus]